MTGNTVRAVADQRRRVLAAIGSPRQDGTIPVAAALGRVTSADVCARSAIPVFDNSAMDGYAVRSADLAAGSPPYRLRVVADVPAGSVASEPVRAGEAIRVMTGAPVPVGADAVVPVEQTDGADADGLGEVRIDVAPQPGAHVRRAGEDLAVGAVVVPRGTVLTAAAVGALAAAGVAQVPVFAPVRVGVVSTGSELVTAGGELGPGQIPESNSVLLGAMAAQAGAELVACQVVGDAPAALRNALVRVRAAGAQVVLTSGGAGGGAFDVVRQVLADRIDFTQVAMQPGRPQGFGVLDDGTAVFALPGNPVAAAVVFEAIVRPALWTLAGRARVDRRVLRATVAQGWTSRADREQWVPVRLGQQGAGCTAVPVTRGAGRAHLAGSLARVEGWAVVPLGVDRVEVGDELEVLDLAPGDMV